MTPAARVAAAIVLLDEILEGKPAERVLTSWARRSRFAGSGDRAAVRDHVFQALRCRRSYAALGGAESGRGLMIGALRADGMDPGLHFTGQGHAPAPLTDIEVSAGRSPAPGAEALDLPDWLWQRFEASLGDAAGAAARELQTRAPTMLRANTRMNTASKVIEILKEDGVLTCLCEIADTALVVTEGPRRLAGSCAYREGCVELQDGSSQAAMVALQVPAGGRILDFCAGGGGKVLALAARHDAQWFAHDIDTARTKDLPERAARAGVEVTELTRAQVTDAAPFDLILCDVPCSGSGTWRRAPEAKWRLTPERLTELQTIQADILDQAAQLVGAQGHIAYTTCSVLSEENDAQVARFLRKNPGWNVAQEVRWPIGPEGDGFYLAALSQVH